MAGEITTTGLTNLINSELIDPMIADYAIDFTVLTPAARQRDLGGARTKTATFEVWSKNTAAAIAEVASSANTALATTEVSITVGKVGITRQPSEEVLATTILGDAGLIDFIASDGGALIAEKQETDGFALFASATTSVSHSTVPFSVAFYIEAMAKMRVLKAPGPWSVFLGSKQSEHLQSSIAATTGAVFGNASANVQNIMGPPDNGYLGPVFRLPVWYSNLRATANAGADEVGAIVVDARGNEKQAPLGFVQLWAPRVMSVQDPRIVAYLYTVHGCYGYGLINANTICKIITSAT